MIIAFDVDGTLINEFDSPRYRVIDLLIDFYGFGHEIWVRSLSFNVASRYIVRETSQNDNRQGVR